MTSYTLYKLTINGAVKYFSTSITEINAFAAVYGLIGKAEPHGDVFYQIPGVVAQHPRGTFSGIKRQYLLPTLKIIIGTNAN